MQCQILQVIHNWIQGNLEGESGNLSLKAFLQAPLQLYEHHCVLVLNFKQVKLVAVLRIDYSINLQHSSEGKVHWNFVKKRLEMIKKTGLNWRGVWNKALSDFWCNVKFSKSFTTENKGIWKENLVIYHLRLFSRQLYEHHCVLVLNFKQVKLVAVLRIDYSINLQHSSEGKVHWNFVKKRLEMIKKTGLKVGWPGLAKRLSIAGEMEKVTRGVSNFCFPNFCKIEPRAFRKAGAFVRVDSKMRRLPAYFDNPGWWILSKNFIYRKTYCVKDDKVHIDSKLVLAFKSEN